VHLSADNRYKLYVNSVLVSCGPARGDLYYWNYETVDLAPYLNAAVVERSFDFNGRTITGTPQIRPRWKRALGEAEASIGDMLGKAYVARHYPPAAKARMEEGAHVGKIVLRAPAAS